MRQGRFRSSRWFWPITFAVAAHVVLGGVLLYQKFEMAPAGEPGPKSKLVDLSSAKQNPDGTGEVKPDALDKQISQGVKKASQMSDRERETILKERTAWVEKYSSVESMQQIGDVVKKSVNAPKRAYEPAENPPPGPFDYESMLPYASKKIVGDDGIERSQQTWVDKDGRVLKQTIRRARDDNGVMKEYRGTYTADGEFFETEIPVTDDGGLNSIVETMSRSQVLQKLFSGAVLPALESQRQKQESSKSAPDSPEPGA